MFEVSFILNMGGRNVPDVALNGFLCENTLRPESNEHSWRIETFGRNENHSGLDRHLMGSYGPAYKRWPSAVISRREYRMAALNTSR